MPFLCYVRFMDLGFMGMILGGNRENKKLNKMLDPRFPQNRDNRIVELGGKWERN